MSEDQFGRSEPATMAPFQAHESSVAESVRPGLPRAARVAAANQSYRAETAWIWQRARLVCAVKDSTT